MSDEKDDLIGFREFIEAEGITPQKEAPKRDTSTGHELATFLERESDRLSKIIDVCEDWVYSLKNYSQFEALKKEQEKANKVLLEKMLPRLMDRDSILTKNLTELLHNHFVHKVNS